MKLHHFLGRLLAPFAAIGFWLHHAFFRTPRARVMVWNEFGQLLLVRNWAGKQHWGLPGGGVEKHESATEAAKRELYEETGITMPLEAFTYLTTLHYKYQAPIYSVTVRSNQLPTAPHNPWEITAIRWFSTDNLPNDVSPLVALGLKALSKPV